MDDMELDFSKDGIESGFVLDTPDRTARNNRMSMSSRDHDSSLLGSLDKRHYWRGRSRSFQDRVPVSKENNDCVVRRPRLVSVPSVPVGIGNPRPHMARRKSENYDALPGNASVSGCILDSDNDKQGVRALSSGISFPKMQMGDKNKFEKDMHGKNLYNSPMEVIEVLDSPEPRTARKSVRGAMPKSIDSKSVVEGTDAAIEHLSLGPDMKCQRQQEKFRPLRLESHANTTTHRMLARNAPSTPYEAANCISIKGKEVCAAGGKSHKNVGEGTDLCSSSVVQNKILNCDATTRKNGQRKLVRNGCIAPSNIAKGKAVLDIKGDGKDTIIESSPGLPSLAETEQESRPNNERNYDDKMKGKVTSYSSDLVNGRNPRPESSSKRLTTDVGPSEGQPDISFFVEESDWKTTGNRKAGVDNSRKLSFPELPIQIHQRETDKSPTILKGKRKSRSARNHLIDSSSDCMESALFSSSGQSSATLPPRSCNSHISGTSHESVIDVDELFSPARCSPERITSTVDDSRARALQLESDERLARQLQEQLFSEAPVFGGVDEIDASIAWSLQQEENSQNTQLIQSRHRSQTSGASAAHLYRQYSRNISSNSIGRMAQNHARASTRVNNLRRNLNRRNMDLDSRIDFLEALEAAFDATVDERVSNRTNPLLHIQRDFNEDDYEMLLALDNDNDRHGGASLRQINSLPLSKVQSENGEACAVCLEAPTLGETIRHLPCLHKFHKNCIDPWLRRKTSCPVCKCGIS